MFPILIHTQPAIHCASVTEHSGRQLDPASSVPSLTGRASCQMVKAHHALKYSGSFKVSLLSLVSHRSHCRRRMGMTVPPPTTTTTTAITCTRRSSRSRGTESGTHRQRQKQIEKETDRKEGRERHRNRETGDIMSLMVGLLLLVVAV